MGRGDEAIQSPTARCGSVIAAVREDDRLPAVSARAFGRKNRRLRGACQIARAGRKTARRGSAPTACGDDAQGYSSPRVRAPVPSARKSHPGAPLSLDPHFSHRERYGLTILNTQQRATVGESIFGGAPPHNIEAEQCLLGAILINNEAYAAATRLSMQTISLSQSIVRYSRSARP